MLQTHFALLDCICVLLQMNFYADFSASKVDIIGGWTDTHACLCPVCSLDQYGGVQTLFGSQALYARFAVPS